MTAHRRGGRPANSRRKRKPARRRSTSTSGENSSDGESVTRCVCGETHSVGLMVQCDKCEVWQHCKCMGLDQPNIPDQYYCEECKPENHYKTIIHGRTKRQYTSTGLDSLPVTIVTVSPKAKPAVDASKSTPKKRMTLNSREASMSLEDVLAARTALEMYEQTHTSSEGEEESTVPLKKEIDTETTSLKRKRELGINLPETIDEKPEPPSSTVSSVGHEELPLFDTKPEDSEPVDQPPVKPRQKRKPKDSPKKINGRTNKKRGKPPRSRTSTPQPEGSPQQQQQQQASDEEHTPDDIGTVLFQHFSAEARASSPPAKIRHPYTRMSISEMNRRANQILEYISSIQVEMATTSSTVLPEQHQNAGHNDSCHHDEPLPQQDDDNDSLSSASTIPLHRSEDEDEEEEPSLADREKQSSMEIMDVLTRKLIKFQKRFGSRNRALYEEAMLEGEGRITRSREASGNVNAYRNMIAH